MRLRTRRATWTKYVRPALSDRRGRAIFPSTPKGYNWYYHYWRRGQDPSQPEWSSWQFPSWYNTHVYPDGKDDPEFIEIRKNTSKVVFDQEYGAEFTSFEGKVYQEFDEKVHVCDLRPIMQRHLQMWRNYWGVDFVFRDPFVCLDIAVDPDENIYVWREHYESGRTTIQHCDALAGRPNPPGFHVDFIAADPSGADGVATMQIRFGKVLARRRPSCDRRKRQGRAWWCHRWFRKTAFLRRSLMQCDPRAQHFPDSWVRPL